LHYDDFVKLVFKFTKTGDLDFYNGLERILTFNFLPSMDVRRFFTGFKLQYQSDKGNGVGLLQSI
jgi:hypothetical protein